MNTPTWRDITATTIVPCARMFFLAYTEGENTVWGFAWQWQDGKYSWDVIRQPESSHPKHYNVGWSYDTLEDLELWLLDSLHMATGRPVGFFVAPSFLQPS